MDFKELRQGNIISLGNRVAKIAWFEGQDQATCYDLEETQDTLESKERIQPEKLTEKWLVKFGFEIIKLRNGETHFANERTNFGNLALRLNDYALIRCNGSNTAVFIYGLRIKCEYVHQLQNLYFALTGKELTAITNT